MFADNHGTFKQVSSNYNEKFDEKTKQIGYEFQKSLYTYDSFQSSIERKFAVLIDKSKKIKRWIRLLMTDNIYLNYWDITGYRRYYPDFIVIDNEDLYYLVEIKSEEDRNNDIVQRKSEAANKWTEKLNSKIKLRKWSFLFITEEDINKSGNDWDNLLKIALN